MDKATPKKVPRLLPFVATLTAAALVTAALGEAGRSALRYDRIGLAQHEWWRLLTGHVVHLSWTHTVLNVTALALVAAIFGPSVRALEWVVAGLAAALAIDAGLYWLSPAVDWYVGLSGVLHGLFAAGTVATWAREPRVAAALAGGLLLKLGFEHWLGPVAATAALTGGHVVTEAHLYGSVGGALAALVWHAVIAPRRASV